MANLIPPIGVVGNFKLSEPLDKLLNPDIKYKVTSVRNIREMIDSGEDVLTFVYINQGLTETDYNDGLDNNVEIVILQSPDGSFYYIPANYIVSIPDYSGHKFKEKVLLVELGQIPDELDLTAVIEEIKAVTYNLLGIEPSIEEVPTSQTIIYTDDEYREFEETRKANKVLNEPCIIAKARLEQTVQEQANRLKLLAERLYNLENPPEEEEE